MRANSCYLYAGENDEAFRQEAYGRLWPVMFASLAQNLVVVELKAVASSRNIG